MILCGGQSPEHEVSLMSAKNVVAAVNLEKYEVAVVGIDKEGRWHLLDEKDFLLQPDDPKRIALKLTDRLVHIVPGSARDNLFSIADGTPLGIIDVVFPVMHGGSAEDGSLQGLLRLLNIPFVGAGVLGSAVGMDKEVMKRLLKDAAVPVAKFVTVTKLKEAPEFGAITRTLGNPVFIKPANTGSSVGISKVRNEEQYRSALEEAFRYDLKVIIEEQIEGREIECSVLGNERPRASVAGEVVPLHEFYSYEAKYIDENGARLIVPAELSTATLQYVQEMAINAYKVLCCEGMARVDFFLKSDGSLYLNEINTIPGFTKISMYPKLWTCTGLQYTQLIEELIGLALDRFERQSALQTTFPVA